MDYINCLGSCCSYNKTNGRGLQITINIQGAAIVTTKQMGENYRLQKLLGSCCSYNKINERLLLITLTVQGAVVVTIKQMGGDNGLH